MTGRGTFRVMVAAAMLLAGTALARAAPVLKSAKGGEVRAFLVGIDKYAYVNQLKGSVADVRDIEGALKNSGVPAANIRVLTDLEATRAAFVTQMDRLVTESKPNDLVIISFSGHGMRVPELAQWKGHDPGGLSEEFVLANFQLTGPGTREGVMNKEMKAWLSRLDARGVDVVFVADTCHGGGLARSVKPEDAPDLTIRLLKDPPKEADNQFVPINVSGRELTIDVQDLPRVSFLAGADRQHVVPEFTIKGQPTPRGALSYAFARAIEGKAADGNGPTTRAQLYGYALQIVSQISKEQQIIDFLPGAGNAAALEMPLMRMVGDGAGSAAPEPAKTSAPPAASDAIRVFALNGDAAGLKNVKAVAQFALTANRGEADIVWDVAGRKVISSTGDMVAENIDNSKLAGVIDRTFAINQINKLSQVHPQTIQLQAGGRRYTRRDTPVIQAPGLKGQHLVVFNITGTGQVQMLSPLKGESDLIGEPQWTFNPPVIAPFGEDRVVAIASPAAMPEVAAWLWSRDQQPVAGLVPDKLAALIAANPAARIGTVGLFTSP